MKLNYIPVNNHGVYVNPFNRRTAN